MHQQLCNQSHTYTCTHSTSGIVQNQAGVILPFAAIIIFVLFLMVGLAIDAGNLYRSRSALQNIADAAALAGVGYVSVVGHSAFEIEVNGGTPPESPLSETQISNYLRPRIQKIINSNISTAAIDIDYDHPPTLNASKDQYKRGNGTTVFTYTADFSARVNLYLLHRLPLSAFGLTSVGRDREIQVTATAKREVANILLAIDVSHSMNCPASDTGRDCSCLTPERTGDSCGGVGELKIDRLIEALKTFLRRFDLERDVIVFAPFNTASITFDSRNFMNVVDQRLSPENLEVLINAMRAAYEPKGYTNICDSLIKGYEAIDTISGDAPFSTVVFSDGAPTATTFNFANPKAALTNSSEEFINYTVQWVSNNSNFGGPGVLAKRGIYPNGVTFGHSDIVPPIAEDVPDCSAMSAVKNNGGSLTAAANTAFNNCVENLGSQLPFGTKVFGEEYGPAGSRSFARWREQYYNCVLEVSDHIRGDNGTVYTIGLGQAAGRVLDPHDPNNPPGLDPYQNVDDTFSRKDFFLARVANDRVRAVTAPIHRSEEPYPDFTYSVRDGQETNPAKTYNDWFTSTSSKEGAYYSSPDDSALGALFEKIARKIEMRLIS